MACNNCVCWWIIAYPFDACGWHLLEYSKVRNSQFCVSGFVPSDSFTAKPTAAINQVPPLHHLLFLPSPAIIPFVHIEALTSHSPQIRSITPFPILRFQIINPRFWPVRVHTLFSWVALRAILACRECGGCVLNNSRREILNLDWAEEKSMGEGVPIYLYLVAFFCTSGAIALALLHIYRHLLNYTEPTFQRFIVRIVFMVPVSHSIN